MVRACAGIPARTKRLDERTEIFQHEIGNESRGGLQLDLPMVGGGFKLGSSGACCHAVMRLVDRRVVEVNYTGDNDDVAGREGVCAPLVRGCVRAHENDDQEVKTARVRR